MTSKSAETEGDRGEEYVCVWRHYGPREEKEGAMKWEVDVDVVEGDGDDMAGGRGNCRERR
jgi:hypothetical protein